MNAEHDGGWSRRPEGLQPGGLFRLTRCPTSGSMKVVILSHDLIGRMVHYWAGRTRPCIPDNCEACNANHRPRWKGYIAGIDLADNSRVIVEVTANVAERIAAEFDHHRTLIGLRMMLERSGKKANGRVLVKFAPPAAGTGELSKAPDLRNILEKIWEVHAGSTARRIIPAVAPLRATGTDHSEPNLD